MGDLLKTFITDGLKKLENNYSSLSDFNNDLLLNIVKESMEYVEKIENLKGKEKHTIAKEIIKEFCKNRNIKQDDKNFDKLIDDTFTFVIKISKNGFSNVNINSSSVNTVQDAFNTIYDTLCKDIEKKYPKTDDVINNTFDIVYLAMSYIEKFPNLDGAKKRLLLKNIIFKFVESLPNVYDGITTEQVTEIKKLLDDAFIFVELAIKAKNGKIEINPVVVTSILDCLFKWFKKCNK